MIKRVLFISLSAILALLIMLTTLYMVDIVNKYSSCQKVCDYYRVSLCYQSFGKRFTSDEYPIILDEFGVTSIIVADDVLSADLTASNEGQSVLILTTSVDITNKAQNFAYSLSDKSSELKLIELSGIITESMMGEMEQLWRLENDAERVTAYKRSDSDLYVLSMKLQIDKLEFAKQNGTKVEGFHKGNAITEE